MHSKVDRTAELAKAIGQAVRREREQLGLRQDELALAAGVSARVIHQIENGKPTSRLDSLMPVLDVIGLTLSVEAQDDQQSREPES